MNQFYIFLSLFLVMNVQQICGQHHLTKTVTSLQEFTALAEKGTWKTVQQKDGITIKYRSLIISDSLKTRELSASFITSTVKDSVLSYLKFPSKIKLWNSNFKEISILEDNESHWISHTIYNIPYPFSQQDLVAENRFFHKGFSTLISSRAIPNYMQPLKNHSREKFHLAEWKLTTLSNTETLLTYSVVSIAKSNIPRFIKDPIIQNKLLNSLLDLKKTLK